MTSKNKKITRYVIACVFVLLLSSIYNVSTAGTYEPLCKKCVDNGVIDRFDFDNNEDQWKGAICGTMDISDFAPHFNLGFLEGSTRVEHHIFKTADDLWISCGSRRTGGVTEHEVIITDG